MKPSSLTLLLVCGLSVAPLAAAQQLGRLFTTPDERVRLERVRAGGKYVPPPKPAMRTGAPLPVPAGGQAGPVPVPGADSAAPFDPSQPSGAQVALVRVPREELLEINGIVTRSGSGRTTTWINSVPHTERDSVPRVVLPPRGQNVGVTLRSGKSVILKPGQRVDAVSGRVREGYQSGTLGAPHKIEVPVEQ